MCFQAESSNRRTSDPHLCCSAAVCQHFSQCVLSFPKLAAREHGRVPTIACGGGGALDANSGKPLPLRTPGPVPATYQAWHAIRRHTLLSRANGKSAAGAADTSVPLDETPPQSVYISRPPWAVTCKRSGRVAGVVERSLQDEERQ